MTFTQIHKPNFSADIILPCRKDDLKSIAQFLPINKPDFNGSFATHQLVYSTSGSRIYLLGIGEAKHSAKIEEAFRKLAFNTKKYWKNAIQVYTEQLSDAEIIKAGIGLQMANYNMAQFASEKVEATELNVQYVANKDISNLIDEGYETGNTINRIKALVDAPPNVKTPEYLGHWAKQSAKNANYKCTVLHENELKKLGFKAQLSVGRASVNKPATIINEYKGKKGDTIDLALVGKGVTFDSGGLSIKPSTNLHYMKSDMGGAAAVLGVVELVAKLKLNINIIGVVVAVENAVGSNAYRPGDVIDSYSGKTIEIIDTDAEGRLCLADGINYVIKNHKPEQLIDLATLTGSVVRTLGYSASGMFTNNDTMAKAMTIAGNNVHERVWPLPLFEDYEDDLHSDIADIRNFSGKPIAGAINAAKFLEAFTENHENWMHLDIAGVAFGSSSYAKMKSASGYGIQLLTQYIKANF